MERGFKELESKIRQEVLNYLVKQNIDLLDNNAVNGVLDTFESQTIIKYMEENNLELGYRFIITDDNNIEIEVWNW